MRSVFIWVGKNILLDWHVLLFWQWRSPTLTTIISNIPMCTARSRKFDKPLVVICYLLLTLHTRLFITLDHSCLNDQWVVFSKNISPNDVPVMLHKKYSLWCPFLLINESKKTKAFTFWPVLMPIFLRSSIVSLTI